MKKDFSPLYTPPAVREAKQAHIKKVGKDLDGAYRVFRRDDEKDLKVKRVEG